MAESADWFRYGGLHFLNMDVDWATDTIKFALVNAAPNLDTTEFWDPSGDGTTGPKSNEVTGTGWAAGGVTLTTVAPALVTAADPDPDFVVLDANDVVEDPVTLTGATHGVIYVAGATPGTDDFVLGLVNFDGARSPSGGEFRVTWSADGVLRGRMDAAA